MKATLVSFGFATAASAAALPGAGRPGDCCFQYDGLNGKQFGSFYYNEAAGIVTNQWGNGCGWGQDGKQFVCGDNAMDSQSWTSTGGDLISWFGHEDYFYACYGEAVIDANIYLQPPQGQNCQKPSTTTSSTTTSPTITSSTITSSTITSSTITSSTITSSTQPSASPFDYASAIDCDGKNTKCRTAANANLATCAAYYATCNACLVANTNCRAAPNANQASCTATVVSCVAAAFPNLV
ncbi:hypothetical protein GTA08_BOTSDO01826 [Neofusicoccum parvum]|uniref:Uncharacterized protein n=1 Tax=Neofusicoccum parvum TaxID=310453 RepID=A0ACB5S0B1_9PEZI|nr:hypothetical protein GTA08_BOTSDO01826 [Neofusicoccum parvum]